MVLVNPSRHHDVKSIRVDPGFNNKLKTDEGLNTILQFGKLTLQIVRRV